MCLYPRLIKNPKYRVNKKNKGTIPYMQDLRVGLVPIKCGYCFECMKQVSNGWKVRLFEEIKEHQYKFITLTFSNEWYTKISKAVIEKGKPKEGYGLDNAIATQAVRWFLERWRKKYKKSLRHWLITELGHKNTEHLHLHGILETEDLDEVERIWKYGFVWKGKRKNGKIINYVNSQTINYISKYVTKTDILHKYYKPKILCSAGIGANYIGTHNAKLNKFKGRETKTTYTTREGFEYSLPIYWRNKIYTEHERELLWIYKLDENVRYVNGEKISADDEKGYYKLVEFYRKINAEMGYGAPNNWKAIDYEHQKRILKQRLRTMPKIE